jgi:hypothetical protein
MEQAEEALQPNGATTAVDSPETYNVKVGTDVNWEPIMQQVTKDELLNGYLRQQDYTRKTQELAQTRKQKEPEGDETEDVKKTLTNLWFLTKDQMQEYVSSLSKQQSEETKLSQLIQSNPELKQFEWAIRTIAKTDNSAIEDIVVKYWFSTHDKLQKAKETRSLVWNPNTVQGDKPKSVADMTPEEFAKFKAWVAKKWDFR